MREIRKKIQDLRIKTQERSFKAMGYDLTKFDKLDQEIAADYKEVIGGIQSQLKGVGKDVATSHMKTWDRWSTSKDIMVQAKYGIVEKLPFFICYPYTEAEYVDHSNPADSVTTTPTSPNSIAELTYDDDPEHTAHPRVQVTGPGRSDPNTYKATVETWFRFSFRTGTAGMYCIQPVIQLNGHHLLFVSNYGDCSNPDFPVTKGEGKVGVTLTVSFEQYGDWVTREIPASRIQELSPNPLIYGAEDSGETHNGVYYDSLIHGGAFTLASLGADRDTTVKITCKIEAEIKHWHWAWVDMKATPDFYFRVPEVKIGYMPWWWLQPYPMLPKQ